MKKEQLLLLTVKELKAMAKENGLKGYSKLCKAELVNLIANYEKEQATLAKEKATFVELLEKSNNTVYTEITHVSTSGMLRAVKTYIKNDYDTQDITEETRKYIGDSYHSSGGLKVAGAGFSAGFDIVYRLSLKLFGHEERGGYKLTQRNMNSKQLGRKISASELLKKGETIVWEKSNNLYMPRYYKAVENEIYYTDDDLKWKKSNSELKDFVNSFDYVTKKEFMQWINK